MKTFKAILTILTALVATSTRAGIADRLLLGADVRLDTVAASSRILSDDADPFGYEKENKSPDRICIYDMPYSINASYPDYRRLAGNTAVLFAGGIVTLGVLALLPEDATAWNKKENEGVPLFQRYFNNVIKGPHFDSDNAIFNYVLHPYAGAAYYMSARSQGFNLWQSWLYSFAVSAFFWEFGIEAFMERPSWQDLIITPMGGLVLGEAFYLAKRHIVQNDYRLLGTKWLGYPVAFLLDPVNECLGYFRGNDAHGWSKRHKATDPTFEMQPQITPLRGGGTTYGFSMKLTF